MLIIENPQNASFLFSTLAYRVPQPLDSQVRRARRGSRLKQHREAVRGSPQGLRSESRPELWTKPRQTRRISWTGPRRGPVSFCCVCYPGLYRIPPCTSTRRASTRASSPSSGRSRSARTSISSSSPRARPRLLVPDLRRLRVPASGSSSAPAAKTPPRPSGSGGEALARALPGGLMPSAKTSLTRDPARRSLRGARRAGGALSDRGSSSARARSSRPRPAGEEDHGVHPVFIIDAGAVGA